MIVSINPSYFCNFRCTFCYLGPELSNRSRLDLNHLSDRLKEVSNFREIEGIDIYGGEVALLGDAYFSELRKVISSFFEGNVKVTTNLSIVPKFLLSEDIDLFVSYDGPARESHERVLAHMRQLTKPFSVLMLASPQLIDQDVAGLIEVFNSIENLKTVEIKPYSANQHNQWGKHTSGWDWLGQEAWIRRWIETPSPKNFEFVNERSVRDSLSARYSSYSDEHIYVTPAGELAVLDFDHEDREFFRVLQGFDQYILWCSKEKEKILSNAFCGSCKYMGRCLSEHLREVKSLERSCNGGFELLDWYEKRVRTYVHA